MPPEKEADNFDCDIALQTDEQIAEIVRALLFSAVSPKLPSLCNKDVSEIYNALLSIRNTILAFSRGDLDAVITIKGTMGGALKALQANLRHLSWVARLVAEGDYTQRVEYMGDLTNSFNSMMQKLDDTTNRLVQEIEEKSKIEKELRLSEEKYRNMALLDPLTEMYNRRHFMNIANIELERAGRNCTVTSVAMIDADYFKNFNDTYGHLNGDMCLKMIANMLLKQIRKIDLAARYGGEEFIILFPDTRISTAKKIAERIRSKIASMPIDVGNAFVHITVSIGLSEISVEQIQSSTIEKNLMSAIYKSDGALYKAKEGRNKVTVVKN